MKKKKEQIRTRHPVIQINLQSNNNKIGENNSFKSNSTVSGIFSLDKENTFISKKERRNKNGDKNFDIYPKIEHFNSIDKHPYMSRTFQLTKSVGETESSSLIEENEYFKIKGIDKISKEKMTERKMKNYYKLKPKLKMGAIPSTTTKRFRPTKSNRNPLECIHQPISPMRKEMENFKRMKIKEEKDLRIKNSTISNSKICQKIKSNVGKEYQSNKNLSFRRTHNKTNQEKKNVIELDLCDGNKGREKLETNNNTIRDVSSFFNFTQDNYENNNSRLLKSYKAHSFSSYEDSIVKSGKDNETKKTQNPNTMEQIISKNEQLMNYNSERMNNDKRKMN